MYRKVESSPASCVVLIGYKRVKSTSRSSPVKVKTIFGGNIEDISE